MLKSSLMVNDPLILVIYPCHVFPLNSMEYNIHFATKVSPWVTTIVTTVIYTRQNSIDA
jgi:hypothetical protein